MSQSDKNSDLSGAIRQLEALLDAQSDTDEQDGENLPVLDDIVADAAADGFDDAFELNAAASFSTTRPDPEQIRALLDRIAGQMETELENVVSMLRQNMLEEFRNEIAAALNMDPQQLDNHSGGQDKQSS